MFASHRWPTPRPHSALREGVRKGGASRQGVRGSGTSAWFAYSAPRGYTFDVLTVRW